MEDGQQAGLASTTAFGSCAQDATAKA